MTPAQVIALRASVGRSLGYGADFDGSMAAYSALSADKQLALVDAVKLYVRAHPEEFNATQQGLASTPLLGTAINYSPVDAVSDFFGALADEADSINESVNPFSATNRKWLLGAVVGVAVLYFLAPVIIGALRAPAGAAAK